MKDLLIGLGLLSCPALVFVVFGGSGMETFDEGARTSETHQSVDLGRVTFAEECARCHGRLGRGTTRAPNLIHPNYGPARASDGRLRRAVRRGVAGRNGNGGMSSYPDLPEPQLDRVVTFLREMQRANGVR